MKSNFEKEIYEQPKVLRRFVMMKAGQIAGLGERLRANPPRFLYIAARGTSDNAANYARYVFGAVNRMPAALAMPSLMTLYRQPPDLRSGLVIGISQSGQSPDVLAVLEEAKNQGVPTLAISNVADAPMVKASDEAIVLDAGEEKSVAASKTYTAQLAAIAMLAAYWSGDAGLIADLDRLGDLVDETLAQSKAVQAIAWRFRSKERLVVVGRGFNHCTTFEVALKVKELVYILSQSYSAADFRHGPIALLEPGFPVVAVAPAGAAQEDMYDLVREARERQAEVAVISNDHRLLAENELAVPLPVALPEWLSPICAVVPGQLLALYLALVKGYDPDKPRGLTKVTRTL